MKNIKKITLAAIILSLSCNSLVGDATETGKEASKTLAQWIQSTLTPAAAPIKTTIANPVPTGFWETGASYFPGNKAIKEFYRTVQQSAGALGKEAEKARTAFSGKEYAAGALLAGLTAGAAGSGIINRLGNYFVPYSRYYRMSDYPYAKPGTFHAQVILNLTDIPEGKRKGIPSHIGISASFENGKLKAIEPTTIKPEQTPSDEQSDVANRAQINQEQAAARKFNETFMKNMNSIQKIKDFPVDNLSSGIEYFLNTLMEQIIPENSNAIKGTIHIGIEDQAGFFGSTRGSSIHTFTTRWLKPINFEFTNPSNDDYKELVRKMYVARLKDATTSATTSDIRIKSMSNLPEEYIEILRKNYNAEPVYYLSIKKGSTLVKKFAPFLTLDALNSELYSYAISNKNINRSMKFEVTLEFTPQPGNDLESIVPGELSTFYYLKPIDIQDEFSASDIANTIGSRSKLESTPSSTATEDETSSDFIDPYQEGSSENGRNSKMNQQEKTRENFNRVLEQIKMKKRPYRQN
jgi:hypothetical protein